MSHEPEKIAKLEQEVNKLEKFKYGGYKPRKKIIVGEEKKFQKIFKVSREDFKTREKYYEREEEKKGIDNPTTSAEETKSATIIPSFAGETENQDSSNVVVNPKT